MKDRTARRPHRRLAAILVVMVLLLVVGAYPLLANAILTFGGVEKAFAGTDQVAVHFRRAWSFWPGRVHVEGARITMQDRNVQFALTIESVDVDIDLFAFARRTFHATRVRGSGVSYRFRHRIEHEAQGLPFVAALPPIPEFSDPPLRNFGPPEAPLDEAHYNLWTVHIEDVDVTVNELWTQMMRFQGDARVVGAFRLRPAKRLWVGPAELEFRSGSLTAGPHDVLGDMRGTLTCKVDDFNVEPVHGMEPFRFISARLQLEAQVAHLGVVNFLTAPSPEYDLRDGSGLIDIDLAIDHGILTPETHLSYRTDHVGVWNEKLPFRLDGELGLIVTGPSQKTGPQVLLTVPRGTLALEKSKHVSPELRGVEIELGTSNADVTQDFPLAHSEARIEDVALPELAWLHDLPQVLPRNWRIQRGRGHASGVVKLQQPSQAIDGSFSVGLGNAVVESDAFKINASADVSGTLRLGTDQEVTLNGRAVTRGEAVVESGAFKVKTSVDVSAAVHVSSDRGFTLNGRAVTQGEAVVTSDAFKVSTSSADILATLRVSADRGVTLQGRAVTQEVELRTEVADASLIGHATLEADLAFPSSGMVGDVRAHAGEWITDASGSRFSGSSLLGGVHFEPTRLSASANVEKLRTSALGPCPWAEAERATVGGQLNMRNEGALDGNVRATLESASLLWGGFEARGREVSVVGNFDEAKLDAKLDGQELEMKNAGGAPRGWDANVGSVAATATFALDDQRAHGPARIEIRDATGQIGKTRVSGDLLAELALSSPNRAHRAAEVSGVVQVRNVALATKDHQIEGWWARFDLDRSKLDISRDFDLAGKIKAQFRDGLPALYILVSEKEIPSLVPTLFPLEGLTFDLGVERYCRWMDIQIIDAHGGPLAAEGRVQIEPGETRGALLLRLAALKPISVGLNFVEDYSDSAAFVGRGWLEKRLVPLTSAATDKHDQKCIPQPPKCQ